MVTGRPPLTRAERLLQAGAPYAKVVQALATNVGTFASMINSEVKFHDESYTNLTVDSSGTGQSEVLTDTAQGDTDQTRNGNSILGKSIFLRGSVSINASNTGARQNVTLWLVCDKQYDGSTEAINALISPLSPLGFMNKDYSDRFVVLKRKNFNLSGSGNGSPTRNFEFYVPTKWHIKYDGSTSGSASLKENQIILYYISDQATDAPTMDFTSRFTFYDN